MKLMPFSMPKVFTSEDGGRLYTVNLVPGVAVYNEDLVQFNDSELRYWNPFRSKLSALILKGTDKIEFDEQNTTLYLGAAAGTTASHLSDITSGGRIYCVEFSERPFRDLLTTCGQRPNMIPILANARKPNEYRSIVEVVDWIYQDISQRDQVEIFIKNAQMYLKNDGRALIMVKSRSINVNLSPQIIYQNVRSQLESGGFQILETTILAPFQKDHAAFVVEFESSF